MESVLLMSYVLDHSQLMNSENNEMFSLGTLIYR